MDRYTKGFVLASLIYFLLPSGLGIWMDMDVTAEEAAGRIK